MYAMRPAHESQTASRCQPRSNGTTSGDSYRIEARDSSNLSRRSYRPARSSITSSASTERMGSVDHAADNFLATENLFCRDRSSRTVSTALDDEEASQWAALERLPTLARVRTGLQLVHCEDGTKRVEKVDVTRMSNEDRRHIVEKILLDIDEGNESLLRKLRERVDRVGIDLPKIEVRYEHLNVVAPVYTGRRATPSILNFFKSMIEWPLNVFGASRKTKINVLSDVSGILKPTRLTLLLGPPESGRTTLLRALAGRLSNNLQVSGEVTYNGHQMSEFVPRKTSAYISQFDLHTPELTVRESLDFYGRIQGVGSRYDMLIDLSRREREAGIKPEAAVDLYLKATSVTGQSNLVTEYVMKLMGLDICADTLIGDAMHRGISGGQKKRVTTAELLVGPAKALFMDEISTGLDSTTTFQVVKMLRQTVHLMDSTIVVSLLQPPPETYALFNDLILLSEGQVVYQGPCSSVLEFMTFMGFKCPDRKATADFLQEVTSRKDQQQYWADRSIPYEYITVSRFVEGFKIFHVGQTLAKEISIPYDKSKSHPAALVHEKYGLGKRELLNACCAREWILMKRHIRTYAAKVFQICVVAFMSATLYLRTRLHHETMNDAIVYMGALFFGLLFLMTAGLAELSFTLIRLPVYHKEKELFLYPAWAFTVPMFILRVPWTILEAAVYVCIVYFVTGFTPEAGRFFRLFLMLFLVNEATIGVFRVAATVGGTTVGALHLGSAINITSIVLGGFVLSRDDMPVWWKWASWCSTLMYGQQAVSVNEFLSKEWIKPFGETTLGIAALQRRGLETRGYWVWLSVGVLLGFIVLFNVLLPLSLQYVDPPAIVRNSAVKSSDTLEEKLAKGPRLSSVEDNNESTEGARHSSQSDGVRARFSFQSNGTARSSGLMDEDAVPGGKEGMVLPFHPLSISFDKISYYVDMPDTMRDQATAGDKLQLLREVSGAFQPGVVTALVGVSGAGKTTLMDVLTGRKTRGYIEGEIMISGYPKQQSTFARIAGYCEQTDVHSPNVTVYESLVYSAWMRLSADVDKETRLMFVEEVMALVELDVLRNFVVGLPGESGLSTEQRKRLTIAVELVANPSIIFMDEPTSGLDARAAAIVMRAVRNIGDTGRTIVCTIHQPSIDIFEAFDELLLLKRGGETIYAGPLGRQSRHLIAYFQSISGVPKIKPGYNPATWMLEVSSISMESKLGVDFAKEFVKSPTYERNAALVKQLSTPAPGSKELKFPTAFAQPFGVRCLACFWKMGMSYYRNTSYSGVRIIFAILMGLLFGSLFWGLGKRRGTQQDIFNLAGASYASVLYLGSNCTITVQPVVATERLVYYRERGARMYSPLTYALAQFFIEWPYCLVQSVLFTAIVYSMMQLEWQYAKVLWFLFFVFANQLFYTYWGMITVAATPNSHMASVLATSFFGIFNLFAGFTITRKQIPPWWRWGYWCTPTAWTLYGLVGSQLGDVETFVLIPDNPGQQITVKQFVRDYFGFDQEFLRWVAVEQIALACSLAILFAAAIKYCNFQQR